MNNNQLSKAFEGHDVTIITDEHGEPWFKGKDVCDILQNKNHNEALGRLDKDDRDGVDITDPIGRKQNAMFINESGLYNLLFTSRLPEAKRFKKWVTSEVLPSIRKTGQYVAPMTDDERLRLLINNCNRLLAEKDALIKFNMIAVETAEKLADEMADDYPKVLYAEAVEASQTDMLIRDYVKTIPGIGQKQLFDKLRKASIVYHVDGSYLAYASYIDKGWFKMRERPYTSPNGNKRTSMQLYITGKGRIKIAERLGLVSSNDKQMRLAV
jgi:anti-repressor protein